MSVVQLEDNDRLDWPARAYVYTSWGYALSEARARAERFQQRMWLFRATLDGEQVWVVSWDPKRRDL